MKYITTDKVKKLKINKNNTYIVMDFDKTITTGDSQDSWAAAGNTLEKQLANDLDNLCNLYEPIEFDYNICFKDKEKYMIKWYSDSIDLYYKYKLTEQKLKQAVLSSRLIFRKGAKEILLKSYEENIPVIILSAGIGNVIEQFLKNNNCYFDNIYIISNFITFNDDGNMIKFDKSKIIHSLNKTIKNRLPDNLQQILKNRDYKILVGDLCEDTNMVEKDMLDKTIKIGMLNKNIKENLSVYKKSFDIVLTEDDANFEVLDKILFN